MAPPVDPLGDAVDEFEPTTLHKKLGPRELDDPPAPPPGQRPPRKRPLSQPGPSSIPPTQIAERSSTLVTPSTGLERSATVATGRAPSHAISGSVSHGDMQIPPTVLTPSGRVTQSGAVSPALAAAPSARQRAASGSQRRHPSGISGNIASMVNHANERRTTTHDANLLVGQHLGSYRLIEILGSGGMGEVYRAEHVKLGREVALKLLRPEYSKSRESVARFFQEARSVNRIQHRNIVDITDLVELGDGTTFIIMELLHGVSLRDWMQLNRYHTDRTLSLMIQICDGLAAAHSVGIIHRDLKPDNVLVVIDNEGQELAKLLDFGIAKLVDDSHDENFGVKTTEGFVMGTPAYMSPEQAGGLPVDERSDLYSLGAVMYEIFTGEPVFRGKSPGEYVRKHLNVAPIPPTETDGGSDLDPDIEAVIMRCLAKRPADRYASASVLRHDLERILSGQPITIESALATRRLQALDDEIDPAETVVPLTTLKPAVQSSKGGHETNMAVGDVPQRTSRKVLWGVIPLLTLAIGAAATWFYLRSQTQQDLVTEADTNHAKPVVSVEPTEATNPADQPDAGADTTGPTPTIAPFEPERGVVTLRFQSKPSNADVLIEATGASQCKTPCDLTLDVSDPYVQRFLIKKARFRPQRITIDLRKPVELISVELKRKRRTDPPGDNIEDVQPTGDPGKGDPANGDPANGDPANGDPANPGDPDPNKPPPDPKEVDPTDTLDPFGGGS